MRVVINEGRVIRGILDHLDASARRATQDRAPPPAAAAAPFHPDPPEGRRQRPGVRGRAEACLGNGPARQRFASCSWKNAQNFFAPPVLKGIYDGSLLSVPMGDLPSTKCFSLSGVSPCRAGSGSSSSEDRGPHADVHEAH
jgi:hypothetical protein